MMRRRGGCRLGDPAMKPLFALLSLTLFLAAAEPPKGEPTNAKEAAAQVCAGAVGLGLGLVLLFSSGWR